MGNTAYKNDVCSHSYSFILDNFFRRLIQNPKKIVGDYIHEGDVVIDLGCGPGYFTIDMAQMVGKKGKIIAVDLQKEMLEKVKIKAAGKKLETQLVFHNCNPDQIGLPLDDKADFILAFYMVHETPDHKKFLKEVMTLLKKKGKFLLVEPLFHVGKNKFNTLCEAAEDIGFRRIGTPFVVGGRSILLSL